MLRIYKVVGSLPSTLVPDAIYIVRVGAGFEIWVTDVAGVPFNLNANGDLVARVQALEGVTPATGTIAGTLTNPPVSMRLGAIYSQSARPFTNHFKLAAAWQSDAGNVMWPSLVAGGYMTAGGQLISIAPGSNGFRTRLFERAPAETGLSGRWRLRWSGTATFDIYGVTAVNTTVANQITFDFTADGQSWSDLVCRTINPAGGQIRDISLVHESDWDAFDAGQIYRNQFLEEVRNYRTIRFDEWIGILRNEEEGGLRITTWASRGLPSDEIFYRFVPYEWMAALCNEVGADMWLCLPTAATDDHIQQAATLIRSLMPAPRHVYVEYSTKTWDFSGTSQAHYTAEQGRIAFGTTEAPTQQEFRNWYAMRTTQMAQWWKSIWQNDPRLHTVIQHQADVVGGEPDLLSAPMWQERNGTLGLPPYVAPASVVDVFAIHAQIDGGLAYHNNDALIETWRTTLTQTEAFDRLRNQMLDARYWVQPGYESENRNVQNMSQKWAYFKQVCDTYDLELACYEVGSHLNGVGNSAETDAFMWAFSVSTQIGEVYDAIFDSLRTIGFDGPVCFSVHDRLPDSNIAHGLQRWLGDHNPAWASVQATNALNNGPTGRGFSDFVGTFETTDSGGGGGLGSVFNAADRVKLDGIQAGATANSTDAHLRDRSGHTGTQAMSTIEGLIDELLWAQQSFFHTPRVRDYPNDDAFQSYWSEWSTGSGTIQSSAFNQVRARPFYCRGLEIRALSMGIQGSITPGRVAEIGIYACRPDGMPGALLRQGAFTVTATNSVSLDLSSNPILPSEHNGKIWVGWSFGNSSSAGTFQWQTTTVNSLARAELGVNRGSSLNVPANVSCVISENLITGADGLGRVWPAQFGNWSRDTQVFPRLDIVVRKPAPAQGA